MVFINMCILVNLWNQSHAQASCNDHVVSVQTPPTPSYFTPLRYSSVAPTA